MSEARPLHVDVHDAHAQVIVLPRNSPPLRVIARPSDAAQTAPTVAAPRGGGQRAFERFSSLHEPARDATVRAAVVLAVLVAIAGVVVAWRLAAVSVDVDGAFDRGAAAAATTREATTREATTREAPPTWRHGWGTVPRKP